MARVTIEDCLDYVDNRFGLVHLVAKRVRQFHRGSKKLVESDNREVVSALREIAAGKVKLDLNSIVQEVESELETA